MYLIFICLILSTSMAVYSSKIGTDLELHQSVVNKIYENRQSWNTSKLGTLMFKNRGFYANKTITVLYWKHWSLYKTRHIYNYGSKWHDPLKNCSVKNCEFTGDIRRLQTVDAVMVDLYYAEWPKVKTRNRAQRWIFLFHESPMNAFGFGPNSKKIHFRSLHNIFNWSMTFASEADVPVPYGRMVPLAAPMYPFKNLTLEKLIPNWKKKQRGVLVAILSSHCVPYRMKLVADLKKYIKVDSHGKCGEKRFLQSCPGHFRSDCEMLSKYLFYLALENTKCKEYITEKVFYNAYYRGAIPIIQGASLDDCKRLLPPHSYLHVDNYATVKDLADHIKRIDQDDNELFNYHWWRNHFEILNEHGYFGTSSVQLCRVCEAMNYNDDSESIYSTADLARFLNKSALCRD